MKTLYRAPSFYAHVINGVLIFFSVLFLYNNYSNIMSEENYKILLLLLLFSIAIGIHCMTHLGLEVNYNYNPLGNDFD